MRSWRRGVASLRCFRLRVRRIFAVKGAAMIHDYSALVRASSEAAASRPWLWESAPSCAGGPLPRRGWLGHDLCQMMVMDQWSYNPLAGTGHGPGGRLHRGLVSIAGEPHSLLWGDPSRRQPLVERPSLPRIWWNAGMVPWYHARIPPDSEVVGRGYDVYAQSP